MNSSYTSRSRACPRRIPTAGCTPASPTSGGTPPTTSRTRQSRETRALGRHLPLDCLPLDAGRSAGLSRRQPLRTAHTLGCSPEPRCRLARLATGSCPRAWAIRTHDGSRPAQRTGLAHQPSEPAVPTPACNSLAAYPLISSPDPIAGDMPPPKVRPHTSTRSEPARLQSGWTGDSEALVAATAMRLAADAGASDPEPGPWAARPPQSLFAWACHSPTSCKRIESNVRTLLPLAADTGVTLALEPHMDYRCARTRPWSSNPSRLPISDSSSTSPAPSPSPKTRSTLPASQHPTSSPPTSGTCASRP